ncbi:MAG: hypothetical protein KF901_27290 [Myxococcales bacterium]|nr:hypothetical protein [Myxococcales bacterium]
MHRTSILLSLVILLGVDGLTPARLAHADAPQEDAQLLRLRRDLVPYRAASVDVVDRLARYASAGQRRRQINDALYLRAVASADLLLIARRTRSAELEARLARSFGTTPEELPRAIIDALGAVNIDPYRPEVEDALAVVSALGRNGLTPPGGPRRDVLYTDAVAAALSGRDHLAALAQLGADPCRRGQVCPRTLSVFDATGRRAITAVQQALLALRRIERTGAEGDPLAAALAGSALVDRAVFASIELAPTVAHFDALGAFTRVDGGGQPMDADLIVRVDAGSVRYAYLPRVRFDAEGNVALFGLGAPLLPEVAAMDLPAAQVAVPQPVEAVVELLASVPADVRVALAPGPDLGMQDLWRVVFSAQRAQRPLMLAARDGSGGLCLRSLSWQEELAGGTEVYVRLGGYSVRSSGALLELPRRREANGWKHDVDGLRAALAGSRGRVAVRAMHVAPASVVVDALFASRDDAVLVRR